MAVEDEIQQASEQFYAALNRTINGDPGGRGAGYAVPGLGEFVVADRRHAGCGGRQDHALSLSDLA